MKIQLRSLTLCVLVPVLWVSCLSTAATGMGRLASSQNLEPSAKSPEPPTPSQVTIPGPLSQFLRMAAVSQEASPEEVLPFLARVVLHHGYTKRQDGSRIPTEYLMLLKGYLTQARELQAFAGPGEEIRLSGCSEAMPLLTTLGYGMDRPCGPGATLTTVDPKRAFLTTDSGFPLADLEDALHNGKPFSYPFASTSVPILFRQKDWSSEGKGPIDTLLDDPASAWLYWSLSRLNGRTRTALWQSLGFKRLVALAPALDFYGSHIEISSGRVAVPGGVPAEDAWRNLVGVSPQSPVEFVARLMEKDAGWLAAYYDTLARLPRPRQSYFTDERRLARFYKALRGRSVLPSPVGASFRPNPNLFILISRVQLDGDGQPHVPGSLQVWKEILRSSLNNKLVRDWARHANSWNQPEQLLEAMVGLSRLSDSRSPLQLYLTLNEIDRRRSPQRRLSPQTVLLLAEKLPLLRDQYSLLSEWPDLDDESISRFVATAESLDSISRPTVRANAIGIFQANIGLWQILARQGEIPTSRLNDSWQRVIHPFSRIRSSEQLLDASLASLSEISGAATGKTWLSQEDLVALLAGPSQKTRSGERVRQELANRMRAALDAQRLVSLNTVFELANGLKQMAEGKDVPTESLVRPAEELREFEMPKPMFTTRERMDWAMGILKDSHTTSEMQTDISSILKHPRRSPNELAAARGLLTPFLRDILVGLNYAYYAPPGAQMLQYCPLFIRSHDFSGEITALGTESSWQWPHVVGRGLTAGRGAHLKGSLADLPYALAEAEQDFIVPENIQALIWQEVVPELLTNAVVPRWWRVTPNELHAVTLYQRCGEELLAAAADNRPLREKLMDILSNRLYPESLQHVEESLGKGSVSEALAALLPAETFFLAAEFRNQYPEEAASWGAAGRELEQLSRQFPDQVSPERISSDFGVPHPVLAHTYATELLGLKPFPSFIGYSSQLMAESWESNNLYWARLAEEKGYAPAMLNELVPALTLRMVEKLFATHLEDWPAILRAMRGTGEEFRRGDLSLGSIVGPAS